jgi:hypothetical protein
VKLTVKNLVAACMKANAAYVTRTPGAVVNAAGIQPDVQSGIKTLESLTAAQWEAINALDIAKDFVRAIEGAPVKVVKRFPQFLAFLASGDHRMLAGSARTAVLVTGAVALCDAKNVNGIRYVATGRGDDNTSDSVSMVKVRANIAAILGRTAASSFATQYSVAYGKNGLCCALGMGSKGASKGAVPSLNRENAVTVATLDALAKLSQIAISDLAQSVQGEEAGEAQ